MSDTTTIEAPAPVAAPAPAPAEVAAPAVEGTEGAEGEAKPAEPEKRHPLEIENKRLRRRVENQARRIGGFEEQARGLHRETIGGTNQQPQDDSEPLSLSRAELDRLTYERARQLAPGVAAQQAEIERRRAVFERLDTDIGSEKFTELAADLKDAFDGDLFLQPGQPKPAADAIFDSVMPRALIEYLADPDNAAEAAALSRMGGVQAGRAVAKLEDKLAAKKAEEKPQASKAAPVIEPIRGGGVPNNLPRDEDPPDVWLRKERARMAKMRQP